MASIASTAAADARPACCSRLSPPRRACSSGRHQEAGLPDAATVEAMLAIALFSVRTTQNYETHLSKQGFCQTGMLAV